MEKIVIFALVILSCVTLSSGSDHSTLSSPTASEVSPSPSSPHPGASSPAPSTTKKGGDEPTPTSGTVSFTASAGLVVSLVMALLH